MADEGSTRPDEGVLYIGSSDSLHLFAFDGSTGEVIVDGSTLYHVTEYRERRDHFAFYSLNRPLVGFDTDREAFLGSADGLQLPEVVRRGEPTNSVANGWAPIASHCVEIVVELSNDHATWAEAEDGTVKTFEAKARLDSDVDVEYYRNGGILPTVLRRLATG